METEQAFRPTPLNKCLLGIGIPLDRDAFIGSLQIENPKDFCKSFKEEYKEFNEAGLWHVYENEVVRGVNKIVGNIEKAGVKVLRGFSLDHFRLLAEYDVVSIVGHSCKNQKIELFDHVYSYDMIVSMIPRNVKCMLDLTICNSASLSNRIKKSCDDIIVFGCLVPISIQTSLLIYELTINIMKNDRTLNYLDAYSKARMMIVTNF